MKEQTDSQSAESPKSKGRYSDLDTCVTWGQGRFIDQPQYRHIHPSWKEEQSKAEMLLVRPGGTGNRICTVSDPDAAVWIAKRLNLAAGTQRILDAGLSPEDTAAMIRLLYIG